MTDITPRPAPLNLEHIPGLAAARSIAQAAEIELETVLIHKESCAALVTHSKEILDTLDAGTIKEEAAAKVVASVETFLKDLCNILAKWSLPAESIAQGESDRALLELQGKFTTVRRKVEVATLALSIQNTVAVGLTTINESGELVKQPRKVGSEVGMNRRSILKASASSGHSSPLKLAQFSIAVNKDDRRCSDQSGGLSSVWQLGSRSHSMAFSFASTDDASHVDGPGGGDLEEDGFMDEEKWRVELETALQNLGSKQINLDSLEIDETRCLGVGGYGRVMAAMWRETPSSPPKVVAVKRMFSYLEKDRRTAIRLVREITIWSDLNHRNVLKMLGFYLSEALDQALIVCPLLEYGSVDHYLQTCEPAPTLEKRLQWALGVLKGLQFLHTQTNPITHGDVKPANVLIGDDGEAVLCDFGLAKAEAYAKVFETTGGFKGSIPYCSPEILDGDSRTPSSDIWAWACTAGEIINDVKPYRTGSNGRQPNLIRVIVHDKEVPLSKEDLNHEIDLALPLQSCWMFDPSERPDASHCMEAFHYMIVRKIALEAMIPTIADDKVTSIPRAADPVNGTKVATLLDLEELASSALSTNLFCGFQSTTVFPTQKLLYKQTISTIEKAVERWSGLPGDRAYLGWQLSADASLILGSWYSRNGKIADAISILDKAVTYARQLTEKDKEEHSLLLAISLSQLACCLKDSNDYQRALDAGQEALPHWRALDAAGSSEYYPAFTSVLDTLGHILCHLGQWDEAAVILHEARHYLQRFKAKREVDLAKTLNQLARGPLIHRGRYDDALKMVKLAVKLMVDQLGQPDVNKNSIRVVQADGLQLWSQCLLNMGEAERALDYSLEAASLMRRLAREGYEHCSIDDPASIRVFQCLAKCLEGVGIAASTTPSPSESGSITKSRLFRRLPVLGSPKPSRSSSVASVAASLFSTTRSRNNSLYSSASESTPDLDQGKGSKGLKVPNIAISDPQGEVRRAASFSFEGETQRPRRREEPRQRASEELQLERAVTPTPSLLSRLRNVGFSKP
ncbi:hypothetical protein FRB93_001804 [Tulasnella sp. JGI-2019a]|nr:hypothetical protein FRB93_001804 [Tulasnella sp. JGI-2019a]